MEVDEKNVLSTKRATVAVSGGFSPPSLEHVVLLKLAARLGEVTVYLNSDEWCAGRSYHKKSFMTFEQRKRVLESLPYVTNVVTVVEDNDGGLCNEIRSRKPDYFVKGFWSELEQIPELATCKEQGTCVVWFIQNTEAEGFSVGNAAVDLRLAIDKSREAAK